MGNPSLDALAALSTNAQNPNGLVQEAIRRKKLQEDLLDQLKSNLYLNPAGAGATPANVARAQSDMDTSEAEDPYFGPEAKKQSDAQEATYQAGQQLKNPNAMAVSAKELADKLAIASAPAKAAGEGALAVEKEKNAGAIAEKAAQNDATMKLLGMVKGEGGGEGARGGLVGPGGTIKPTINANGGVSFMTTQMPALVQRARNQLMDARDKTVAALDEAERMYPGIFDEAAKSDSDTGGSAVGRFLGGVTGIGAGKYSGPTARMGAGLERANYTLGIPTPFSKLAQEASFGNIEQMAGQLPGVRGLATITPMFKEHQSRWGHEAPTATVQRLMHMVDLMNGTLHTLDTSGAGGPEQ